MSTLLGLWHVMTKTRIHQNFLDSGLVEMLFLLNITLFVLQIIHIYKMQLKYKQNSLF